MGFFSNPEKEKRKAAEARAKAEKENRLAVEARAKAKMEAERVEMMKVSQKASIENERMRLEKEKAERDHFLSLDPEVQKQILQEKKEKEQHIIDERNENERIMQEKIQSRQKGISKADYIDITADAKSSGLTTYNIGGTIAYIDCTEPFIFLKISIRKSGFIGDKQDNLEINIPIQDIINIRIKKEFLSGSAITFSFPTMLDYEGLKLIVDESGELKLKFKKDSLQLVENLINKVKNY